MVTPQMPGEEVQRLAHEWYARSIRRQVETPENIGKEVVIDVNTGDFEVDHDGMRANDRLEARHPDGCFYGIRIGFNAVYAIGGALRRTDAA
jgi:hypothetical protein